jgi:hypothetical protein
VSEYDLTLLKHQVAQSLCQGDDSLHDGVRKEETLEIFIREIVRSELARALRNRGEAVSDEKEKVLLDILRLWTVMAKTTGEEYDKAFTELGQVIVWNIPDALARSAPNTQTVLK